MAGLGRKVWTSETLSVTDLQGYVQDQVVMVFASSAARSAAVPAPADGMLSYLTSPGRFEGRVNGAWVRLGDRTLGDGWFSATAGAVISDPTGWTDIAAVTATSTGGECIARWLCTLANGNSGADRTATMRVVADATTLGSVGPIGIPVANLPRITRAGVYTSSPGAGSHTWKLQAQANTLSSVIVEAGSLTIVERGLA